MAKEIVAAAIIFFIGLFAFISVPYVFEHFCGEPKYQGESHVIDEICQFAKDEKQLIDTGIFKLADKGEKNFQNF